MRIHPLPPETLPKELRYVHDEIAHLVGRSQGQVTMMNDQGALLGPFPPMLHYPQFGIPALSFLRTLDEHATLDKRLREVVILTVGAAFRARFELYAHEIMAASFGMAASDIVALSAGAHPQWLDESETIAHHVAFALANGSVISDSTYNHAVKLLGKDRVAELIFLVASYSLIAMILNGFDVPTP